MLTLRLPCIDYPRLRSSSRHPALSPRHLAFASPAGAQVPLTEHYAVVVQNPVYYSVRSMVLGVPAQVRSTPGCSSQRPCSVAGHARALEAHLMNPLGCLLLRSEALKLLRAGLRPMMPPLPSAASPAAHADPAARAVHGV